MVTHFVSGSVSVASVKVINRTYMVSKEAGLGIWIVGTQTRRKSVGLLGTTGAVKSRVNSVTRAFSVKGGLLKKVILSQHPHKFSE